jgi:hypothetical protein
LTRFGGWKAFQACFWLIHRRPTCLWTIWLHSLGYFLAMVDITFWICFFLHSSHGGGQIPLRISGAIPKKTIWKLFKLTWEKVQINCLNVLTKILQFYFEYFSIHLGLRNFPGIKEPHSSVYTWVLTTDYGHTKAKFLILCGPNRYFCCGYKGLVFCRNNGWIMENMDKGLTVPKWAHCSKRKSYSW